MPWLFHRRTPRSNSTSAYLQPAADVPGCHRCSWTGRRGAPSSTKLARLFDRPAISAPPGPVKGVWPPLSHSAVGPLSGGAGNGSAGSSRFSVAGRRAGAQAGFFTISADRPGGWRPDHPHAESASESAVIPALHSHEQRYSLIGASTSRSGRHRIRPLSQLQSRSHDANRREGTRPRHVPRLASSTGADERSLPNR